MLNPSEGEIELPSLGLRSKYNNKKIKTIKLICEKEKIEFTQKNDKLILNIPAKRLNIYVAVFELKGVLSFYSRIHSFMALEIIKEIQ